MNRLLNIALSIIVAVALANMLVPPASAQKAMRKKLKSEAVSSLISDTIDETNVVKLMDDSLVRLSGFDKTLSSTRESLFITNLSDSETIVSLILKLKYIDSNGRTLHRARRKLQLNIPPGESRYASYRSFDTQGSFYYVNSRPPRSSGAAIFDVEIGVDSVVARNF